VKLAIDDFGTGYATLDYIRHFGFADELKIDRAFVDGVERPGSHEEAIARAAIELGRSFGMSVVAEGVETEEQELFLRAIGCRHVQGYRFGRPALLADLHAGASDDPRTGRLCA
jgi:EAL domain-containing protein (putative c-di-GMP-specific phosphodiesterase class I)